jgi:predicted nucleotidyltransferase
LRLFATVMGGWKMENSVIKKTIANTAIKVKKNPSAIKTLKETFEDRLQIILDTILENVDHELIKKIYLFGSYAYGKPNKNSDIDICVVVADDADITETYMKFAVPLFDKGIVPVDKLMYHKSEFEEKKDKQGIVNTIITKGRLLYG